MGAVRTLVLTFLVSTALAAGTAFAQEGPGGAINPGRDCQSITTCNFKKGGYFRGCISTYSCRVCSFVPSRCQIGAVSRRCQKLRCSWGA